MKVPQRLLDSISEISNKVLQAEHRYFRVVDTDVSTESFKDYLTRLEINEERVLVITLEV